MTQTQPSPSQSQLPFEPNDGHSADFLLAEYERLRDIRAELAQKASRRFEFYVPISSAILGAYLVVTQTQGQPTLPWYAFDLIALGLLGYGVITFLNLTFASTFHLQLVRAFKEIQKYFIGRDSSVKKYLYFSTPIKPSNRYRFPRILMRGMAGGSEKSVIASTDSALATYLLISLLRNLLFVQLSGVGIVVLAIATFVILGLIHGIYVTLAYRYAKTRE